MLAMMLLVIVGWVPADWATFESGSRACRVELPARPGRTATRTVPGPAGEAQLTTAELDSPAGTYSVQVTENAARVDPQTLDAGVRQFAASRRATLGAVQIITVAGHPGREFELTANQRRSRCRIVAAGGTLVVLAAAGPLGTGVPADADRFLGSLAIGTAPSVKPAGAATTSQAAMASAGEAEATDARLARAEADLARARGKTKEAVEFASASEGGAMIVADDDGDDEPKPTPKAPAPAATPVEVVIGPLPSESRPYADAKLRDLAKSLASEREGFRDVGPEGSVLVGVRVSYIERFGGPKVRSVQPIYRSGDSHYEGQIHGEVVGPVTTVVARPDYAVGGLVTHTGLTLDGFGIVFMKVEGDHLDPKDTYNSPWIGDRKGGNPGGVTTPGGLVVGLQGRAGDEVNALGLTMRR